MRIRLRCDGISDRKKIAQQVERSLYLTIGSYVAEVRQATVHLEHCTDKMMSRHRCRISLKTASGETIQTQLEAAAIDDCILQAASAVSRTLRLNFSHPNRRRFQHSRAPETLSETIEE